MGHHPILLGLAIPRLSPHFHRRNGLSLVEVLVVVAVIALLLALAVPGLSSLRSRAGSIRELAALRGLASAWALYATDQRGWLLPAVYGLPPLNTLPAFHEDGQPIPETVFGTQRGVVARWPHRISRYLDHQIQPLAVSSEAWQVDTCSEGDLMKRLYFTSLYPAFGMNGMWVGGDQERYGFMPETVGGRPNPFRNFYASRLGSVRHPERLVVFASSRTNQDACASGSVREGYFRLESPQWLGPQWASAYDPLLATSFGNLSARWSGQASVANANGSVELVPVDELRDMRRWADQADARDWRFKPN
jgi:prepilin-type N-terminal cleavage/methylation domain-containing protein